MRQSGYSFSSILAKIIPATIEIKSKLFHINRVLEDLNHLPNIPAFLETTLGLITNHLHGYFDFKNYTKGNFNLRKYFHDKVENARFFIEYTISQDEKRGAEETIDLIKYHQTHYDDKNLVTF